MKKITIFTALILNAAFAFSQITYQYDNLNRLSKVNYPNGTNTVYVYDELGNRQSKTITSTNIAVTGVSLNQTTMSLSIGQTGQLTATVIPGNATNQQITWESSNETVAIVSTSGLVTAKQVGTATITVRTVDGNKTASCVVTVKNTDAKLSNLTVSTGTLTPSFNSTVFDYTVDLPYNINTITLSATPNDPNATITGDGIKNLNMGTNNFTITVTAEDGVTTQNYVVTVTRAYNSDVMLSNLSVSTGTLTPPFNSIVFNYTVDVPYNVISITLTATANDPNATVTGAGVKTLSTGENSFTITVTAEDGVTTQNYTVTVIRAYNSDATLSSLTIPVGVGTLTPPFQSDLLNYTVDTEPAISEITITAIPNDANATVSGDIGFQHLETGNNLFTINVTAEDEITTLKYTISVYRPVGIIEPSQLHNLKVYPNPTTGELRIDASTGSATNGELKIENVEIFDIYGRKLSSNHLIPESSNHLIPESSHYLINISHLQAGIYFLKIDGIVVKVIKM